jgi:hypothetical protein
VSGVVTAILIGVPATLLIGRAGTAGGILHMGPQQQVQRTLTVPAPVNAVTVTSDGAPVRIVTGAVSKVEVTMTIGYGDRTAPPPGAGFAAVNSAGLLTLSEQACGNQDANCWVGFSVIAPRAVGVTVASSGGPVTLAGVTGASVDSGGGGVSAQQVSGPLTVTSEGGPVVADGVTGTLNIDTGGGAVTGQGLSSAGVTVRSEGGPATLGFATAPRSVSIRSGGGPARLDVPGGPYALTADSGGGPESVEIATDPSARPSLAVSTEGGPLLIYPATASDKASGSLRVLPGTGGPGRKLPVLLPPAPPKP